MEPKRYEINTLEKLINVANPDNIDKLSIDFLVWLSHIVYFTKEVKEKNPEETKNKTNYEILQSTFVWIDDGKNDFIGVSLKNTTTGEVTNIPFPKKDK